ncbi:26S proteasome non-ATPase regulatory subunit 10-like [Mytilus californianus]|uniref:26S proteasome non-ATPase regulatory subunit 10-like n=1 Tax=Mytilus californianus TaxID=6549 RepID=UPI0022452517|nr:26S proteasome non-ATPase regulatory subunit 10-like [Mytilus californianus]
MSFRSLQEDCVQEKDDVLMNRARCYRRSNSTPIICEQVKKDINATDSKGRTSLYFAAKYGNKELLRHLLELGADPNIPDSTLTFPIHEAIDNAFMDIVELLIDYDCDVNCKNLLGQTPLIRSTLFGDIDTAKLLIKSGADLDEIECTGKTALLVGLREGNDKICNHLIRYECDVNIMDNIGYSALYLAVHRSSEPSITMCQKLYKAGYDFENDCHWLSKDLHRIITQTGLISSMLQKLGLKQIRLENEDTHFDIRDSLLTDSCSRMI